MRISDVKVHIMTFPHPPGHEWNKGDTSAQAWDQIVVEVHTDEGIVGIGESYHLKNPMSVATTVEQSLRPLLLGRDPFNIESLWNDMFQRTHQLGFAASGSIGGVDTALHDIKGQALGVPIYELLGGRTTPTHVPAYVGGHCLGWRALDDLDDLVAECKVYVDQGFKGLKLRGGRPGRHGGDIESVKAVREAFGDSIDILIDANGEYKDSHTALTMARLLAEHDVFWLESPLTYSTSYHPAELARVSREAPIRIATGGNLFNRFGARQLLEAGSSAVVMLNVSKAAGISETKKIQALLSAFNSKYSPHCEGGFNALANLHAFASAPPHLTHGMYFEWDPLWPNADLMTEAPKVVDGCVVLPDGPGLGSKMKPGVTETHRWQAGTYYTRTGE